MFSRDTRRYPFHARAAYIPDAAQLPDDPLGVYRERMRELGIDRAMLVQPEPYGDDHQLVLDCLARAPELLRATALFYPDDPFAAQKLGALVEHHPAIVAVRFHAHRGKDHYFGSFADAGVRALWGRAAELGLIVELHIGPNYAAQAAELIRAYPSTPVLIDHLGEPQFGAPGEYPDVLALARYDNVSMKLSGLDYVADDAPLYLGARPLTRQLADAFGPARLVWGGGTPAIVDAHLDHFSDADRALVKGGNLARLLGFA
jgi:predicted TIM-barrel fold metal-dependent hydrolase